jgi:hypothetical protein
MFAKVELQTATGYLHIDRGNCIEPVLPVKLHSEEIQIEIFGLLFIKDAEYRDCLKFHAG